MANRRMFSKKIINTDTFLDMPLSSQSLYFHLAMEADDDGFIGNAKTIRRMIGASEDDLKLLTAKQFIIPFESGVVVIRDWHIHNYIRKDRYNETMYLEEKKQLLVNDNEQYEFSIPMVDQRLPEGSLGKYRLGEEKDTQLKNEKKDTSSFQDDAPPSVRINLKNTGNDLLKYYAEVYRVKTGKNHPEIEVSRVSDLAAEIEQVEFRDCTLEYEQIPELIDYHFDNLPSNNDGKIYAFNHLEYKSRIAAEFLEQVSVPF